jgi:membrane protein YdbS with pleckstrin-like domain
MLSGALIVVAVALVTAGVSRFMWWACRRSPLWSMAAGALLAVLALGGAVTIAWLMTRAKYGR